MKQVMQKRLTFTPIVGGEELSKQTIDLLTARVEFQYGEGVTFMCAPNMRGWVQIKETQEEIDTFLNAPEKPYTVRNTTQIISEGNDDYKLN